MIKTYFLIAIRRLWRDNTYAAICILSLAIGIASLLVISNFLWFELSYDRHHVNHGRLYRVHTHGAISGSAATLATVTRGVVHELVNTYPQLGTSVEFERVLRETNFSYGDVSRSWADVYASDNAFTTFTHDVVYGNPLHALDDPNSIAISRTFANFYFGSENPIGKTIKHGDVPRRVSLVFEDLPLNTHLRYSALIPLESGIGINKVDEGNGNFTNFYSPSYQYLFTKVDFDPELFHRLAKQFNATLPDELVRRLTTSLELAPLTALHLRSETLLNDLPTNSPGAVFGLAALGFLIAVIAGINSVNLATARATRRIHEISLLNTLGAKPWHIALQALIESLLITTIAIIIALAIFELLSAYGPITLLQDSLRALNWQTNAGLFTLLVMMCLIVSIVIALYPTWYLTSLGVSGQKVSRARSNVKGLRLRSILAGVQIVLSIGALTGTMLLYAQTQYIANKDLGFKLNDQLVISSIDPTRSDESVRALIFELEKIPSVLSASRAGWTPGSSYPFQAQVSLPDDGSGNIESQVVLMLGDWNYPLTMGLDLSYGRYFSETSQVDNQHGILVNETFVRTYHLENPLGKVIQVSAPGVTKTSVTIIGVLRDFHLRSFYETIPAVAIAQSAIVSNPTMKGLLAGQDLLVSVESGLLNTAMPQINKIVGDFFSRPDHYNRVLQDTWRQSYKSEYATLKQTQFFSLISVMLCLLGIYGQSAFNAESRQREVSIRKTIGASTVSLLGLLSRQTVLISIVASIPAWIIVYFLVSKWLQRFAYHIDIGLLPFLFATFVILALALLTIVIQSLKTAQRNPAEVLRHE